MRKVTGSWLSGPQAALDESPSNFAGEKLGATEHGPGSIATLGRRVGALLIDWLIVALPTNLILGVDGSWILGGISSTIPIIWAFISVASVWAFSLTPGMAATGLAVGRVDADAPVGLWRAVVRTLLTLCVFPALFQDEDLRGMHDRATGTAVVRSR
ncbi:MAG TPA: RDD family protein [Dietzia timorensis]|uniref:RDD family protein n=1 Tax=Dietzia timorensis TaxID=499555 RepID=A0A921JY23_9ACTN|nr:RDD family protein [Dietzia timorensis]HJE89406.1 RDD family protein [Dietzia timorensis]